MNKIMEEEKNQSERLVDRSFFEWMFEKLNRKQLVALSLAINIQLTPHAKEKLPEGFLRNKLLLKRARTKLINTKVKPPFPFFIDLNEEELSKNKLIILANENGCNEREIALILFLQNYFEEALNLYDNRTIKNLSNNKIHVPLKNNEKRVNNQPTEINSNDKISPKIEKKLQNKIRNLLLENKELTDSLQKMKNEFKEKKSEHLRILNELQQALALEKKQNLELKSELDKLKKTIDHSKRESKTKKITIKKTAKKKMKIALIGDPRNQSLIKNDMFDIDVFELDTIPKFIDNYMQYDHVFYLSYTLDEAIYEEMICEEIRKKIIRIDQFLKLKEVMGGLNK